MRAVFSFSRFAYSDASKPKINTGGKAGRLIRAKHLSSSQGAACGRHSRGMRPLERDGFRQFGDAGAGAGGEAEMTVRSA